MEYDSLMNLIDGMASEFLLLETGEIDIPTAGKLLNNLDNLIKEADALEIGQLKKMAGGLSSLLEKIVLDSIEDKAAGFNILEKGIPLMQEIADTFRNTGGYEGDINGFMESLAALTGDQITKDAPETEASQEESQPSEKGEVQDESLLRDFIIESLEYINEIEVNTLNLEQEPENKDHINAIFRPFHSIKGVAAFLNLEQVRDVAHDLETLLDKARNDEISVTSHIIDVVLDGADALKAMIIRLQDDMEGGTPGPLEIDIPALRKRIKAIDEPGTPNMEKTGELLGEMLVEDGAITQESVGKSLEVAQADPQKKIGETLIAEGKVTPKQVSNALRKQTKQAMDTATIRVNVKKLDDLIDMVGELVITQSMIRQNPIIQSNVDQKLAKDISQLSGITSELQRTSTSLRMVPIKQTFQRMSRLVRDLSKGVGKSIGVVLEGEDTDIDKNMVDEIYNPLVHMIRNAVDHGIESGEERIASDKPEKGLVQLKAYHRGGSVVIEISDDGKGLDKDKILKKAIQNGVINSSQGLSDQDIYKLIFHPGLSTAKEVTDVSGRGVGMDVVKQAVEKLCGKIEINSVCGKGTSIMTFFPLTMAIIDGITVRVGKEKYIIPTGAIRQLLRPLQEFYNNVVGKGEMINVMGDLMPLVRLHEFFGIKCDHENPWEAIVAVVEGKDRSKCIMVDEIVGEEEVVIKSLGESLKDIPGISSGAILGDGNVGLILDAEGLFELSEV
ncbi:MAG: chemotaxis protein CheA [Thermodesulfobacteriota bacterium]|nr:chemotaxis protein CheA [Thermodesulfobacteriota bacterium]